MLRVCCVLLCLLAVAAQRPQGCGGKCTVDAQCRGICRQCIFGQCGSGCSFGCTKDTNCLDPNCPFCYGGHCGNSPHHTCNQDCVHSTDCEQNPAVTPCSTCINGKCSATCGGRCKNDTNCLSPGCNQCQVQTKGSFVCVQSNKKCGAKCFTNDQCDQSSVCNKCNIGKCGAGCARPCTASSQCSDRNCEVCNKSNLCAHTGGGKTCGQSCLLNSDCSVSPTNCGKCVFGKCGAACSDVCIKNSDCLTAGCQVCGASTAADGTQVKMCTYP